MLLKVSQNLYADTLLKAIGRPADGGPATTREGRRVSREVLQGWGIAPDRYLQADGSGLSRYNYLTADVLGAVLPRMYSDNRHIEPFINALPVAGVDGTIAGRMKDTPAQGNARAKTGSIANARALSGYVTSAEGEPLVGVEGEGQDAHHHALLRLGGVARHGQGVVPVVVAVHVGHLEVGLVDGGGQRHGRLSSGRASEWNEKPPAVFTAGGRGIAGGADRDRTDGLLNAIQALSQLSYSPVAIATHQFSREDGV